MYRMQWQCLSCQDHTLSLEIPFAQHADLPPAELYCTGCQRMTTHEALMPKQPRPTVGDALALARLEEEPENSALAS